MVLFFAPIFLLLAQSSSPQLSAWSPCLVFNHSIYLRPMHCVFQQTIKPWKRTTRPHIIENNLSKPNLISNKYTSLNQLLCKPNIKVRKKVEAFEMRVEGWVSWWRDGVGAAGVKATIATCGELHRGCWWWDDGEMLIFTFYFYVHIYRREIIESNCYF